MAYGGVLLQVPKGKLDEDAQSFIANDVDCVIYIKDQKLSLDEYKGREIEIGIRPEHILIIDHEGPDGPSSTYDCKMEIVATENMGNEQQVYFKSQERSLIVRQEPRENIQFGDIRPLHFLRDKLFFFDPASGNLIG